MGKIKPIILPKTGRSAEGQKAISSHTGSLAGSQAVTEAALKQAGVIQANSLNELFNYAHIFSAQPLARGKRVAIVANAGGPSVLTTDLIAESSLQLAKFSPATLRDLKKNLPATAALHNPVDVIGDARADRYQAALESVLRDKKVDSVIVLLTPQTVTEIEKTAGVISALNKKYDKPMVASFIGGKKVQVGRDILAAAGVPAYDYPQEAVSALSVMADYYKIKKSKVNKTKTQTLDFKIWKRTERILHNSTKQVEWGKAEEILKDYKIPVVPSAIALNVVAATRIARKLSYPVAMKVVAPKLVHKTDAGGVKINLKTPQEIEQAFRQLNKVAKKYDGQILVQSMVKDAKEIIIGLKRDPQFGPVVMFGLGGVYVEVLKDVVFRVAPINFDQALTMVKEIKSFDLLKGTRGEKGVKLESIAEMIVKFSYLAVDFPQIQEIEANPAMATTKGCQVVDIRIMI